MLQSQYWNIRNIFPFHACSICSLHKQPASFLHPQRKQPNGFCSATSSLCVFALKFGPATVSELELPAFRLREGKLAVLSLQSSAGWSRTIHSPAEKRDNARRRRWCACAARHEMNKSARTRRLAASEQSKRCSWTSDAACGATALSPPPPDCRLRPHTSPTKGRCENNH